MNRWIMFWGCEAQVGRQTLAKNLARTWAEKGKQVLLFSVGLEGTYYSDEDLKLWISRFESLSPLLLRNYLASRHDSYATFHLAHWPNDETLQKLSGLLKRSFDRVIAYSLQEVFFPERVSWLDNADLLLCVARPSPASVTGLQDLLTALSMAHLPHSFCQLVLNRLSLKELSAQVLSPRLPGREALEKIREDFDYGLRIKEGVERLCCLLEERESLYVPRPAEGTSTTPKIIEDIKNRVQPQLLHVLDPKEAAQKTVEACLAEDSTLCATREERGTLLTKVLDEVLGLGPLEPLLKDPTISEIMVNGIHSVYMEKKGCLYPTHVHFSSETQLRMIIDRIVTPLGRRVDESMPLCDARLPDGSRVNIVLPPLALDGPSVTIRKFMAKALSVEDLVNLGSLSRLMADFLRACVLARKNIVVSGGTGSGKTTLLNALSSLIPENERIVTIEDAAELRLQKPHVVRLESRPANAEGEGAVPIRRLVMNALRMRPDRIVVGECRGGEALDMLQAMNTGHDGSLTTVHANSPRDALGRLETLVLMSGMDLPLRVVREQIRSAVHVIIQQARLSDGTRKVISITEITGMEEDRLSTQELFRFQGNRFEPTGVISRLLPMEPA